MIEDGTEGSIRGGDDDDDDDDDDENNDDRNATRGNDGDVWDSRRDKGRDSPVDVCHLRL